MPTDDAPLAGLLTLRGPGAPTIAFVATALLLGIATTAEVPRSYFDTGPGHVELAGLLFVVFVLGGALLAAVGVSIRRPYLAYPTLVAGCVAVTVVAVSSPLRELVSYAAGSACTDVTRRANAMPWNPRVALLFLVALVPPVAVARSAHAPHTADAHAHLAWKMGAWLTVVAAVLVLVGLATPGAALVLVLAGAPLLAAALRDTTRRVRTLSALVAGGDSWVGPPSPDDPAHLPPLATFPAWLPCDGVLRVGAPPRGAAYRASRLRVAVARYPGDVVAAARALRGRLDWQRRGLALALTFAALLALAAVASVGEPSRAFVLYLPPC